MKRDGYNRTSLCVRRLHVVLFGRNFRCALVSALIGFASVAFSQSPPYASFQTDMANLLHAVQNIAGDTGSSSQPLGIQQIMWELYNDYWQPMSPVDGWDPDTNAGARALDRSKGLLRLIWDQNKFWLPGENSYYIDPDQNSLGFTMWNYQYGNPDFVSPGFVEFMSLTLGQQFDAGTYWDSANRAAGWEGAFGGPYSDVAIGSSESVFAFWVPWQAEAWRRQLGALGMRTNSWWAVTNSGAYKSLDRVFESQQFQDYYMPTPLDEATSNFVDSVPAVETEMPHLGFELVGTNVVQLRDLNDITNASLHLQPDDIMPGHDVGQWLFRVSGNTGDNLVGGTYEVDLSGTTFAQWASRIPDWIQLLCNIVYYAFSAVVWFKTAVYYMDKVPE